MEIYYKDGTKEYTLKLDKGGTIIYIPNFIENTEEILKHLKEDIVWKQGKYNNVLTPRLLSALGNQHEKYKITDSYEFTKPIKKIKKLIEKEYDTNIEYAQLNYYRDGNDYIGWHTDKEVEKGDSIYSVSIGCTRKFQLMPIYSNDDDIKYNLLLKNGSSQSKTETLPLYVNKLCLLTFNGSLIILDQDASKNYYKHQLLKEPKINKERINITFRNK